ncbi:Vacuole morphology and inheritance protein 14 [Dioscorea alata]|uniref:Vacuole morphology and inheritance protein 14 n=1 Tax=Dioscorea alata TaxID=55571 RepID=A0ACB7U717_DIOAL|nr:Vacuole morphology and inheritance protein 14 [Dioscorea alata]
MERFVLPKFYLVVQINEFRKLGVDQLASYYSAILDAILFNFSDPEENIRELAHEINEDILEAYARPDERSNIIAVLSIFTEEIGSEWQDTRIVALHCITKLLEWHRAEVLSYFNKDIDSLLKALSDPSDEVVLLVLEVHACIAREAEQFDRLFDFLAKKFRTDFSFLQMRGPLIVRKLCTLLNTEQVHQKFSSLREGEDYLKLTSKFLLRPNFHLVKSTELAEVRVVLNQTLVNAAGEDLCHSLYSSLGYSESGTVCLRLLAQAYHHENYVVLPLIKEDMNMILFSLTNLEAFVCLLQNPTFDYRKFQRIERSFWLLKLLYCLWMLLPQCMEPGNSIWLLTFLYFLRMFLPKKNSVVDLFERRLQTIPGHSFICPHFN